VIRKSAPLCVVLETNLFASGKPWIPDANVTPATPGSAFSLEMSSACRASSSFHMSDNE
jgi:hypothetical protein